MWAKKVVWMFAVAMLAVGVAQGTGGGILSWEFQDTGWNASGAGAPGALAMRGGLVWPTIFAVEGSALSVFPVKAPEMESYWHLIGEDLFGQQIQPERIRAASHPDGKVLAVGSNKRGVVSMLPYGWTDLPEGITAAAFDGDGNVVWADRDGIAGLGLPQAAQPIVDIAVSSCGNVAAIDAELNYHEYNPWTDTWGRPEDLRMLADNLDLESVDLEFDARCRPHVVGHSPERDELVALDFHPAIGWSKEVLVEDMLIPTWLALAANSQGVVGTAWERAGELTYAFKTDLDPWAKTTVTAGLGGPVVDAVGVAFDHNDLPVLSYVKDANIWLAYDPVIVPEPAAMTLFAIGGAAFCRGRRRV